MATNTSTITRLRANIKFLSALLKKYSPKTRRYVALGQQIRRYQAAIHQLENKS